MEDFAAAMHAEKTAEVHRHAYNAAFDDLGLLWHWDAQTWQDLSTAGPEEQLLRSYVQTQHPHLLKAYDADFLIGAITNAKARHYASRTAGTSHFHS